MIMDKIGKVIFDLTDPSTKVGKFMLDLTDPRTAIGAAFYGLITLVVAWLIGRAVKMAIHRYLDRAEKAGADATGIRFLGKLASVGIYLVAFGCYAHIIPCLLYTSPSPRDRQKSRMPS